jgi:hypothetical protein
MELRLVRTDLSSECTIGELHVNGEFECFTLEDVVRPVKIKGMTAIRSGTYEVIVSFSARFQRPLPQLLNVPEFDGIRIHSGNTAADTEGCILVGQSKAASSIGASRGAFEALFGKIQSAAAIEKIFIEITQPEEAGSAFGGLPAGGVSVRRARTSGGT